MEVRVSASSLRDYMTCRKKLYYRIHRAPRVKTASLILGSFVHDMVEDYEKGRELKSTASLLEQLSEPGIKFYRGQTIPKLVNKLNTCFENYLEYRKTFEPLIESERWFSFPYEHAGIEAKMVGKFDGIAAKDTIVELKTSKNIPNASYLIAEIQPMFYIWAYEKMYGKKPRFLYFHLPSGKIFNIRHRNMADMLSVIHLMMRDCVEENFPREWDGYKCKYCDYRELCNEAGGSCKVFFEK